MLFHVFLVFSILIDVSLISVVLILKVVVVFLLDNFNHLVSLPGSISALLILATIALAFMFVVLCGGSRTANHLLLLAQHLAYCLLVPLVELVERHQSDLVLLWKVCVWHGRWL